MGNTVRKLIWLYFWTIIFEGVFRKWLTPGLANELLLIREPIVAACYFLALSENRFPRERPVILAILLGILAFVFSGILLSVPLAVSFFGLKASFFHIPMIYLIPRYFDRDDVLRMGKYILLLAIPNAVLMVMQFGVSPDHWLNASAGGGAGQMEGAQGRIRAPGLFPFITGSAQFIALALSFTLFGLVSREAYRRKLLYLVLGLLVISLVVSISRLAIGNAVVVTGMLGVIAVYSRSQKLRMFTSVAVPLLLVALVVSRFEVFDEGVEAFEQRLTRTGDIDVGFGGTALNWYQRTLNDLTAGLYLAAGKISFTGEGLGMGTNVAARFITGDLGFLLAEGEWARLVLEMGPLLGLAMIGIRLAIVWFMLQLSLAAIQKGNFLPILLFGGSFLLVVNGQWGQATTQGFAILGAGLTLAATRIPDKAPLEGGRRRA
ncbi:MAG: hypothetical protein JJU20_07570 [Opitutales bacterium]|nr:hypothetical protein [Opitutales bacterium]